MGIIDAFVEKGCRVVVTTHLNLIKAYGYTKDFAVNVATSFDSQNMKTSLPTCLRDGRILQCDKCREKYQCACRLLLKKVMPISRTGIYAQRSDNQPGARKGEGAKRAYGTQQSQRKRHASALRLIREKRDEYIRKLEEKCQEKLLELEMEIEKIKKDVAKKERTSITKSKKRILSLKEKVGGSAKEAREDIRIGDYVLVKTLGSKGYVVDIDEEGNVSKLPSVT